MNYRNKLALALIAGAAGLTPQAARAVEIFDGSDWLKIACTTYPLNLSSNPTGSGVQDPAVVYDPALMWDETPQAGGPYYFDGYQWTMTTYTDSAAAGSALATGQKTYNNAINISDTGEELTTIVETAHATGRKTGTISSVQFTHATPAAMSNAHSVSRNDYAGIAMQMIYGNGGTVENPVEPVLDVIMGCGHPGYNNNAQAVATGNTSYVGGSAAWADMGAGAGGATSSGFQVIHTQSAFEALAVDDSISGRYLGIPEVGTTLQQSRSGGSASDTPYEDALNTGVPTLETMTRAALNVLDGNSNDPNQQGFFLHVEGGAVDWANHARTLGRAIEEQQDFNNAVKAVDEYLTADTNGNNWSNTLVILTADHECGFLVGPDGTAVAYDPLVDNGEGNLPGHTYISGNHTNALVPIYAKGPGSELLLSLIDGYDDQLVDRYGATGFDGAYVDNTDIHTIMAEAMDGDGRWDAKNVILMISDGAGFNTWSAASMYGPVPEPATLFVLGMGLITLVRRR